MKVELEAFFQPSEHEVRCNSFVDAVNNLPTGDLTVTATNATLEDIQKVDKLQDLPETFRTPRHVARATREACLSDRDSAVFNTATVEITAWNGRDRGQLEQTSADVLELAVKHGAEEIEADRILEEPELEGFLINATFYSKSFKNSAEFF